jgi:hypothetical protein
MPGPTTQPDITDSPVAPDKSDRATFSPRATAWATWIRDVHIPELRDVLTWIHDTAQSVYDWATAASDSAAAAAASAATAVNAPGTSGTSITSLTIGAGAQSFTTQTGKSWKGGQPVVIARTAAPTTTWMAGIISSYDSSTGAMGVTIASGWVAGTGTYTDWTIGLTAPTPSALPVTSSFLTQATNRLLGRTTASAGAVEEISVDSTLTLSAGQLKVTTKPGLVLIASATASSSASIDFTGFDSTYDEYELHLQNIVPASASASPYLRMTHDGTTWVNAGNTYNYCFLGYTSSGTASSLSSTGTAIQLANNPATGAEGLSGLIRLVNPSATGINKQCTFVMTNDPASGGNLEVVVGAGEIKDATTAVVGARIVFSSGLIASGTAHLYGVRKS